MIATVEVIEELWRKPDAWAKRTDEKGLYGRILLDFKVQKIAPLLSNDYWDYLHTFTRLWEHGVEQQPLTLGVEKVEKGRRLLEEILSLLLQEALLQGDFQVFGACYVVYSPLFLRFDDPIKDLKIPDEPEIRRVISGFRRLIDTLKQYEKLLKKRR